MKRGALAILVVAAILVVGLLLLRDRPTTDGSPNVLLITLDTTRADHLGCYGYEAIRTPNLDALAADGTLFGEAFSAQPVTLPSHCSILTGRYPFRHGVRDNNIYSLALENSTLAEILAEAGYSTGAVVSAFVLDRRFGLDQGFGVYDDRFENSRQTGRTYVERRAEETSRRAVAWLDSVTARPDHPPFFLWLHYFDPHQGYDPPSPYKEAYPNAYDGEIAYTDDWLGFVLEHLAERDLADDTIVVVLADHGEGLGEHGEDTHGLFIYRPTTRVPLIVKVPGLPAGRRIDERVGSVDVFPTILELVGLESPVAVDGRSLVPLLEGDDPVGGERPVYSEVYLTRGFNWSHLQGIRQGDRYYIRAPRPELYAQAPGLGETEDIIGAHPDRAAVLDERLDSLLKAAEAVSAGEVVLSDELIDKLRSLGYTAGGSRDIDDAVILPDPKDRVEAFRLYQQATILVDDEKLGPAREILEEIVARDPGNPRFLLELGDACRRLGDHDAADRFLGRAAELDPEDARIRYLLGRSDLARGRTATAETRFREALNLDPDHAAALSQLARLFARSERWDEAEEAFQRIGRLVPDDHSNLANLGFVAIAGRDDFEQGIPLLERALAAAPDDPALLHNLGWAHLRRGDPAAAAPYYEQALRLVPDSPLFIEQLQAVYTALGDEDRLRELAERVRIIGGD